MKSHFQISCYGEPTARCLGNRAESVSGGKEFLEVLFSSSDYTSPIHEWMEEKD